jgi:DNA methylase
MWNLGLLTSRRPTPVQENGSHRRKPFFWRVYPRSSRSRMMVMKAPFDAKQSRSRLTRHIGHPMPKTANRSDETKYRLMSPLDAETYVGLKANIALNGVQVPVVRDEKGYILDGFARAKIAIELGYECPSVTLSGLSEQEKRSQVRALNLARRHLDHAAKRQVIADELRENSGRSNRWIARALGVDDKTVARVRLDLHSTAALPQLGFTLGWDGKYRPATRSGLPTNGHGGPACELPVDGERGYIEVDDEEGILRNATEIRQRRIAERGRIEAEKEESARVKLKGKRTWTLTDDPKIVRCDLLIVDPPFGITDEPWEPEDVEAFTREWSRRWAACGADFVAIFWCQDRLWDGRKWFDESLRGYEFQQLLTWQASNNCGPKNRNLFKQTWYPIFLYRRRGSCRKIITGEKTWDKEKHNFDCHVAPVPQSDYTGEDHKRHPCQKPVSTMRWLINALSEPGELVGSHFCGVAPCGVAAVQLGRRYRGIEQSGEYRKIAEGRIAAYKRQRLDSSDEKATVWTAAEPLEVDGTGSTSR